MTKRYFVIMCDTGVIYFYDMIQLRRMVMAVWAAQLVQAQLPSQCCIKFENLSKSRRPQISEANAARWQQPGP
jgi:hypothetical protein